MSASRDDVIREALSWEGTPFADCCAVKGSGTDCAMLLVSVYSAVGLIPKIDPRPYKPQWFEHQERPVFIEWLERYAHRVEVPLPGDVTLLKFGKHAAHGAIYLGGTTYLHAYKPCGKVMKDDRRGLVHRMDSHWSLF